MQLYPVMNRVKFRPAVLSRCLPGESWLRLRRKRCIYTYDVCGTNERTNTKLAASWPARYHHRRRNSGDTCARRRRPRKLHIGSPPLLERNKKPSRIKSVADQKWTRLQLASPLLATGSKSSRCCEISLSRFHGEKSGVPRIYVQISHQSSAIGDARASETSFFPENSSRFSSAFVSTFLQRRARNLRRRRNCHTSCARARDEQSRPSPPPHAAAAVTIKMQGNCAECMHATYAISQRTAKLVANNDLSRLTSCRSNAFEMSYACRHCRQGYKPTTSQESTQSSCATMTLLMRSPKITFYIDSIPIHDAATYSLPHSQSGIFVSTASPVVGLRQPPPSERKAEDAFKNIITVHKFSSPKKRSLRLRLSLQPYAKCGHDLLLFETR